MSTCKYTESVEKWGTFEAEMPGKHEGNPFTDYAIQGTFKGKEETKTVDGFYDGDGIYRVRFHAIHLKAIIHLRSEEAFLMRCTQVHSM